jgi:hypothetical protein
VTPFVPQKARVRIIARAVVMSGIAAAAVIAAVAVTLLIASH